MGRVTSDRAHTETPGGEFLENAISVSEITLGPLVSCGIIIPRIACFGERSGAHCSSKKKSRKIKTPQHGR